MERNLEATDLIDWTWAAGAFVAGIVVGTVVLSLMRGSRKTGSQVIGVAPVITTGAVQMPVTAEPTDSAAKINELEAELVSLRRRAAQVDPLQTEIASLRVALARGTGADPFERIRGIGGVFAQKLHAAGFLTFEQLSHATVDELHEIISPEEWQKVDFLAWKREAKEWADGVREVTSRR